MYHSTNYSIALLIIFISLNGCAKSKKHNEKSPIDIFPHKEELKGDIVDIASDKILNPTQMVLIDSLLVLFDFYDENSMSLLNINKKRFIKRFGKKGKGPNELITPFSLLGSIKERDFDVFDFTNQKLITYNMDSVLSNITVKFGDEVKFTGDKPQIMKVVQLKDNYYVGIGIFNEGRYALMNKQGELIKTEFNYPYSKSEENIDNKFKAMAYQGKLVARPDGKRVVLGVHSCGILEICELKNNKLRKIKDLHSYTCEYKTEEQGKGFGAPIDKDSKAGYVDLTVTQKYIYALYSGKSYSESGMDLLLANHLLIYDWNGNPVKYFYLNHSIKAICVNAGNNLIYGITQTPAPKIVEYNFNLN